MEKVWWYMCKKIVKRKTEGIKIEVCVSFRSLESCGKRLQFCLLSEFCLNVGTAEDKDLKGWNREIV